MQVVFEKEGLGLALGLLGLLGVLLVVLLFLVLKLFLLFFLVFVFVLVIQLFGDIADLFQRVPGQDIVVLGVFDLEADDRVLLDELDRLDGQMLGVIGDQRRPGQQGGHLGVVEEGLFRLQDRVHNIKRAPLGGLERIPESIGRFQPAGLDGRIEEELADLLRRPSGSQIVVGFPGSGHFRRGRDDRPEEEDQNDKGDEKAKRTFHGISWRERG